LIAQKQRGTFSHPLTSRLAPILVYLSETGASQLFALFSFWFLVFGSMPARLFTALIKKAKN
jgi:hypothetical protein